MQLIILTAHLIKNRARATSRLIGVIATKQASPRVHPHPRLAVIKEDWKHYLLFRGEGGKEWGGVGGEKYNFLVHFIQMKANYSKSPLG